MVLVRRVWWTGYHGLGRSKGTDVDALLFNEVELMMNVISMLCDAQPLS